MASAAEELTASVGEIGTSGLGRRGDRARSRRRDGARQPTVESLASAAAQIGEIVRLISEIASQTNLLALNALSKPPARARPAKALRLSPPRSRHWPARRQATEEIASQVGSIQNATSGAVSAIQAVSTTIATISEISSAIAAAVRNRPLPPPKSVEMCSRLPRRHADDRDQRQPSERRRHRDRCRRAQVRGAAKT